MLRCRRSHILAVLLLTLCAPAFAALPDVVADAVRKAFPGAAVRSYGREREGGVRYYEVNLIRAGSRFEVEVDRYGGIGEVEARCKRSDLPDDIAQAIGEKLGWNSIAGIEVHERRGVGRGDRFLPLAQPRVFYEIKYRKGGRIHELIVRSQNGIVGIRPERENAAEEEVWDDDEKPATTGGAKAGAAEKDAHPVLPAPALKVLQAAYPNALIGGATELLQDGKPVYELRISRQGIATDLVVWSDGRILMLETEVTERDLPREVVPEFKKATEGGHVMKIVRREQRGEVKEGAFVAWPKARVMHTVTCAFGGDVKKISLGALQMAQLPAVARAAIMKEFPKGQITSTEMGEEAGAPLYEVTVLLARNELLATVTAAGVITSIEGEGGADLLPKAVAAAVKKAVPKGTVTEVELVELRAVVKGGKLTVLPRPRFVFNVELDTPDGERELSVALDGTILENRED